jgi:4-hydroxy-4-methyl-2-oxoglutarate aldolase
MVFNTPEGIAALTPQNPFERLPDGRPCVPAEWLERMELVTTEEAWSIGRRNNYRFQFEGNWQNLHPERILVGRAVTAQFLPIRPDLHDYVEAWGTGNGRSGGQNTWVIDSLTEHDVLVVDLFGKIKDGTIVGDNLSTGIKSRGGAGLVVDGGIRDLQRVMQLTGFNAFLRGVDPSAIADVTLVGVNVPIRIGNATVLPGDVVLGTPTGVMFIPPHLAQAVVEHSENTRLRDVFGQQRIAEGRYTSGQIDVGKWADDIEADYQMWFASR